MSMPFNDKLIDATHGDGMKDRNTGRAQATGDISEMTVIADGEERTTIFVWLLVCASSISGLLFGKPRPCRQYIALT